MNPSDKKLETLNSVRFSREDEGHEESNTSVLGRLQH